MNNLFLNRYPYTDFHELNLSWLIQVITEVQTTLEQFVSINALKYADPIQWNITTQYEKNTIVIDPVSGVAYISVQPVPSGVALTNTDYWTVVFDLGQFVVRASQNFTNNYEDDTTTTATFASNAGDWLVWGDTLYKALVNITPGDTYVVNGNIEHFTMEELTGHLDTLLTTDKTSLVNAINELFNLIGSGSSAVGDLDDLNTTDKTTIVNAINEVLYDVGLVDTKVGDLNDLTTNDKTSIVNAINEVKKYGGIFINVKSYGAVGDGVTDDTTAIQDAVDSIGTDNYILYFPAGTYLISSEIVMPVNSGIIFGDGRMLSSILTDDCSGLSFTGAKGVELHSFGIKCNVQGSIGSVGIKLLDRTLRINIYDMYFYQNYYDILIDDKDTEILINAITSFNWTKASIIAGVSGYCGSINVTNSFFKTDHGIITNAAIALKYVDVVNLHGNTIITPLSNNVVIFPDAGQIASLITMDGNCFDTSENGISCTGNGRITRLVINGNTVQEMDTTGLLLDNGDMDYVTITDNIMFNTPYCINIAENCVIEDCDISNNILTGDQLGIRLAGTTTALKVNENILGTAKYGLTMPNGIVTTATIEGVAFGNIYNNVTTPVQNNSSNFDVHDYPTPYTPVDPRVETPLTITTDANGNAVLTGFTDNTITMLEVLNLQGDFLMLPYWDNTNTNWYVHVTDVLGAPIVSTPFNVKVIHIGTWS